MVCRGVDLRTERPVALKMLSPEAGEDPNVVERMLREQQAMVALEGTCAVTAIDLCRLPGGAPCLVMEWLEGRDLERQLHEWETSGVRPGAQRLLELLRPLTETLLRAHEIGIVHRDIKPGNIFLTNGKPPGVRLLDFGLSRMKSAAPLTELGMVMGSPSYIAPETWGGNSALIDYRADLYSLAVIAFRWLAGEPPFDTPNLLNKMLLVTKSERPSLCALCPELPAAIDPWLRRGLAIDPNERFQSAGELFATLSEALELGSATPNEFAPGDVKAGAGTSANQAEHRSVLATAWSAATALLRRFTGQGDSQPTHAPPPPPPQIAAAPPTALDAIEEGSDSVASFGDRKSVWLDDADLEERPLDLDEGVPPSPDNLAAKDTAPEGAAPPQAPQKKRAQKKQAQRKPTQKKRAQKKPAQKNDALSSPALNVSISEAELNENGGGHKKAARVRKRQRSKI